MIGYVGIAVLVAFFAWWLSTGVILVTVRMADRRGKGSHLKITILVMAILVLGLWGYRSSVNTNDIRSTYIAFFSALAIWGWIELAFLSGVITGPNKLDAPKGLPEWERFRRAWGTVAYHELLLFSFLIWVVSIGWGKENTVGCWTFIILYCARISAKLNLYFGVPRINIEFIPKKLMHLPSHFRQSELNQFFPVAVTVLTFAVACWIERVFASNAMPDKVGYSLLAALSTLALIEHWLMVVPLPDAKLWRWMLPAPSAIRKELNSEDVHGL